MRVNAAGVTVRIDGTGIVAGADLDIADGEVVGLVGPNGSGKSTLLRCVYRMLRPAAGVVRIGEADVWALSARDSAKRTAIVVQEAPTDFDLSVRQVVLMGRAPHKRLLDRDDRSDHRLVAEALQRVGVAELGERSYRTLSGGEKQRVLLARALAQRTGLLVLDEPTNHLDIRYQLEMLRLVRSLETSTLAALHDLNLAAAYCDRLYVMSGGRVVAHGTPEQVLTPALVREVFEVEALAGVHPVTGSVQLAFY